jgi:CheY-like chemotaxis protein
MKVLVVEDDPGVRRVTMRFLTHAGASVTAVEDGAARVAAFERHAVDGTPLQLVVSDLRLPRGSGAEVLQTARRLFPEAALVAMSGFLEDDEVARMADAQQLVFIAKPFTAAQLIRSVETARASLHRD